MSLASLFTQRVAANDEEEHDGRRAHCTRSGITRPTPRTISGAVFIGDVAGAQDTGRGSRSRSTGGSRFSLSAPTERSSQDSTRSCAPLSPHNPHEGPRPRSTDDDWEEAMQTQTRIGSTARVGTAELYYELRGGGAPVLLIPGVPGDAGQFASVAEDLADEHRVVTYDRRGNSRSARPEGWEETSVAEQVEDAARLLERLGAAPALVYGTSVGAIVALELAIARPDLVSGVALHEMPLMSVLTEPGPVLAAIGEILEPAFTRGGPAEALEAFLRFAYGDAIIDGLEPDERARMLGNGAVAMTIEFPVFQPYRPDAAALRSLSRPAHVLVGREQRLPMFHEAGAWLADALATEVAASPGAHGPQFDRPSALAACIAALAPPSL